MPGRNIANCSVGETEQPHRVALVYEQIRQRAGDPAGVVKLASMLSRKRHGCTAVEQDVAAQVCVGLEFLDIKAVGSSIDPPVDSPCVVAGRILAVFGEFHA